MKKVIYTWLLTIVGLNAQSQWQTSSGSIYYNSGNVGVGTSSPNALVDVKYRDESSNLIRATDANHQYRWRVDQGFDMVFTNSQGSDVIKFGVTKSYLNSGNIGIYTFDPQALLDIRYKDSNTNLLRATDANNQYRLRIDQGFDMIFTNSGGSDVIKIGPGSTWINSGNLLIGKTTQTNGAYKLDVNGSIRANEVVVNTTGADFVFEETYKLKDLREVDQYIKVHHHLPDIASSTEMQENGLELGQMDMKLLQKIEELTLYMIDLRIETEKVKEENQKLRDRVTALEK